MKASDETVQEPKVVTKLRVCCAISQRTTVTQAELSAATGSGQGCRVNYYARQSDV